MSDNPYQAPLADEPAAAGVRSGRREDLRSVAIYQKGVLIYILINLVYIMINLCFGVGLFYMSDRVQLILLLIYVPVTLAGLVCICLLATKVYNSVLGIFWGLLTLIPCLGLIVLLIVNSKATSVLQLNGYKVGFLGADLSAFNC